jgi:NitT/TauT family transport system ATP-binding protein
MKMLLMLSIKELSFAYGDRPILDGVSFSVDGGEIVALIGVSGSGKTTLFRLITGLIPPSEGDIEIDGRTGSQSKERVTYMRQEDLLLPWRTVLGNLMLCSELGKEVQRPSEGAKYLLKRVGLEGYEGAYPQELSGGMRQRVALARSLLHNRPLMLLDEPFASLDVILREHLYDLLKDIRKKDCKTIVMVTHDFRDAIALADRILILSKGKIVGSFCVHTYPRDALIDRVREIL